MSSDGNSHKLQTYNLTWTQHEQCISCVTLQHMLVHHLCECRTFPPPEWRCCWTRLKQLKLIHWQHKRHNRLKTTESITETSLQSAGGVIKLMIQTHTHTLYKWSFCSFSHTLVSENKLLCRFDKIHVRLDRINVCVWSKAGWSCTAFHSSFIPV